MLSQKDEQKVILSISFLIAAEGADPKASAGVPAAGSDNPNSSCSVRHQSEVGETKQYDVLYMLLCLQPKEKKYCDHDSNMWLYLIVFCGGLLD